jgi:hypothetical protein
MKIHASLALFMALSYSTATATAELLNKTEPIDKLATNATEAKPGPKANETIAKEETLVGPVNATDGNATTPIVDEKVKEVKPDKGNTTIESLTVDLPVKPVEEKPAVNATVDEKPVSNVTEGATKKKEDATVKVTPLISPINTTDKPFITDFEKKVESATSNATVALPSEAKNASEPETLAVDGDKKKGNDTVKEEPKATTPAAKLNETVANKTSAAEKGPSGDKKNDTAAAGPVSEGSLYTAESLGNESAPFKVEEVAGEVDKVVDAPFDGVIVNVTDTKSVPVKVNEAAGKVDDKEAPAVSSAVDAGKEKDKGKDADTAPETNVTEPAKVVTTPMTWEKVTGSTTATTTKEKPVKEEPVKEPGAKDSPKGEAIASEASDVPSDVPSDSPSDVPSKSPIAEGDFASAASSVPTITSNVATKPKQRNLRRQQGRM